MAPLRLVVDIEELLPLLFGPPVERLIPTTTMSVMWLTRASTIAPALRASFWATGRPAH